MARTNQTDKRNDIAVNIWDEIIPPIERRGNGRERTTEETLHELPINMKR